MTTENDSDFLARKLFSVMYQLPSDVRHEVVSRTFDDAESLRYMELVPKTGWTRRAKRHLTAWKKEVKKND